MKYEENAIYHIFNRSNEILFYNRKNFIYFIAKLRKHILPYADILAYCLMPNHFHLITRVNSKGTSYMNVKGKENMQFFANSLGLITSSYTQAINKQNQRKGSLFAHAVKAKLLNDSSDDYGLNCFMYVHQNPLLVNLVAKIEDWEFSSFPDYIEKRNGTLVNKELALRMFQLDKNEIYNLTYKLLFDKIDEDFL